MINKILIVVSFLCISLTACDPGQILFIDVSPQKKLSATIFGNKKILSLYESAKEKAVIKVPSSDTSTDYQRTITYRIGNWGKAEVVGLSANIDSIILKTSHGIIVIKERKKIQDYLQKNIGGNFKNVITINVN